MTGRLSRQERREGTARRERRYHFDKGAYPHLTTLAWVMLHRESLANEFLDSLRQAEILDGSDEERFERWQVRRFGDQLEEVARMLLWAEIQRRMYERREQ